MSKLVRTATARALLLAMLSSSVAIAAEPVSSQPAGLVVYVIDGSPGVGPPSKLLAVDAASGSQTVVSSGGLLENSVGVAPGPNGSMYVTNFTNGLLKIDVASGSQSVVSTDGVFTTTNGIATLPDGTVLIADAFGFGGAIYAVDPAAGSQTILSSGGSFLLPADVAVGPNGRVVVADQGPAGPGGTIWMIDPVSGAQTAISSGGFFERPRGITFGPDGLIYVSDGEAFGGGGAIFRVDPQTGSQEVVSSGGNFVDPRDVQFGPDGNLYVVDPEAFGGPGALFIVDIATGSQSTVSSGGVFVNPRELAFAPSPSAPHDPNLAPFFAAPTCNSTVLVPVLAPAGAGRVSVSARDPNPGQAVTVTASGLAPYASFTATPGNPATGRLDAAPTIVDWLVGLIAPSTPVTLAASDDGTPALTSTCAVTMRVNLVEGSPI